MDVVAMPQLGETVTEGTITSWAVVVGDVVAVDDALFDVSTEKVDTEVPSAVAGHVRAILVPAGDTVAVGTPVAVLTESADEPFDLASVGAPIAAPPAPTPDAGGGADVDSNDAADAETDALRATSAAEGPPLSPVVRRILTDGRIDPSTVAGSGRDGRVTRADALAAAAAKAGGNAHGSATAAGSPSTPPAARAATAADPVPIAADDEVIDFSRARLTTAEHMVRSLGTAAHALVVVEVDYSNVDRVRRGSGLSYLPFVARACIEALRDHPHVNASVDTSTGSHRLVVHPRLHLGVAVDVEGEALVVPVVHDAQDLRLGSLAARVAELADLARRRRLGPDDQQGGTFTITNVGSHGTVIATPIINQPQVAILSTDGVRMAPVAAPLGEGDDRSWGLAVHPVGNLSLSFDHRAIDGAYAASFLAQVRSVLQDRAWAEELSG